MSRVKKKVDDNSINDTQGRVPRYNPSDFEKKHLKHIYQRKGEMEDYMKKLGLFSEWAECEVLYENSQKVNAKKRKKKGIPSLNIATEIEIVETKSSEEKKVMPQAVLSPVDEADRAKVDAFQKIIEHIKNNNQDELKKFELIDNKNIYGIAYQKIYWKEVYKDVKIITGSEKWNKKDEDYIIPKFKWETHKVLASKDICIENIRPEDILVNESARCMDEVYEGCQMFYTNYDVAKEEYGNFKNFKYIKRGQMNEETTSYLRQNKIQVQDIKNIDCAGILYWNEPKDEYSVIINGVLLTQFDEQGGNPIPYKYFKKFPFTRAICRHIPGDRQFFSKGDVMLIRRLKEIKNILINAITKSTVTNAAAVLIVTKEVKEQLKNIEWQMAGVLEAKSKENADATRTLNVHAEGVNEALALIGKIDEYITTITGVDSRALLSTIQETATKTATRQETSLKRINSGTQHLEYDTLYRKMQIMVALIREYYQESKEYLDSENKDKEGNPKKIKVPNTIPIKGKRFSWIDTTDPIPTDIIKGLISEGLDKEVVAKLFVKSSDNRTYEFVPDNANELRKLNCYKVLTIELKEKLIALMDQVSHIDLSSEETDEKTVSELEIRKELFEVDFEIEIRPAGVSPFSELYENEKIAEVARTLGDNPFVNQQELAKRVLEAAKIRDYEKLIKPEQQVNQEQQRSFDQELQLKGAGGQPQTTEGIPPEANPFGGGQPPQPTT